MAKILVIASLASSLVRFRGDLLRGMVAAGHEVTGVAPDFDDGTMRELASWRISAIETPLARSGLNPFSDLGYMNRLRTIVRKEKPEVVLAYTPKPVMYSGMACDKETKHFGLISGLGYGFGTETFRQRILGKLMIALYRRGLRSSQRVIFQNPDDLELFVSKGIVDRSRTCLVAGSGVDPERFAPKPLPQAPVFLLMARLIPEKGIREFVAAAKAVKLRVGEAKFLLAGWIEQRRGAISREEVEGWQRDGLIQYLGALDDVRPAIAQAAVYVLPSYYREGVPRSVLEAMSMGRAIITTDMPGCRETVRDGRNGVLVPPRNMDALASAMHEMAIDPDTVARMGIESRKIIEERFTVERVNGQMMRAMGLSA